MPDSKTISLDEDDVWPQAELSLFDNSLANMSTATEFFGQLKTLHDISKNLTDLRHAQRLLDSILTPELAAQASAEAAMASAYGGLTIGGFTTKYLVKHAYDKEAPFTKFLSEDVALSVTDAMFNISSSLLTGGVAPVISQSISTTSNIIDSVIAYRGLGGDTDKLVDDARVYAFDMLRLYWDGTLSVDQALAHLELTQELSENLMGRVPAFTWAPSREAAYKLRILAQLGQIRIEQGPQGRSLELTQNVRREIRRMDTWDAPGPTLFKGPVFQNFADEVAVQFGVMNWEPLTNGAPDSHLIAEPDGPLQADTAALLDSDRNVISSDHEQLEERPSPNVEPLREEGLQMIVEGDYATALELLERSLEIEQDEAIAGRVERLRMFLNVQAGEGRANGER